MHYVSTACLRGKEGRFEKDLFRTLEIYKRLNIKNIELGSVHKYMPDLGPLFKYKKENDVNFIIHTFFPPAKKPFMVNIGSNNPKVLKASLDVAKNAIETCNKVESNLYSIHPGLLRDYTQDMEILSEQVKREIVLETMVNSLNELLDYAGKYDIRIAVENMGSNMGIFHIPEDFSYIFNRIKTKKLGVLLDIGHLRITYSDLNKQLDFVNKIKDRIFEMHIHELDSNGIDHSKLLNPKIIKDFKLETKNIALTLESNWMTEKDIAESKKVLERL